MLMSTGRKLLAVALLVILVVTGFAYWYTSKDGAANSNTWINDKIDKQEADEKAVLTEKSEDPKEIETTGKNEFKVSVSKENTSDMPADVFVFNETNGNAGNTTHNKPSDSISVVPSEDTSDDDNITNSEEENVPESPIEIDEIRLPIVPF